MTVIGKNVTAQITDVKKTTGEAVLSYFRTTARKHNTKKKEAKDISTSVII